MPNFMIASNGILVIFILLCLNYNAMTLIIIGIAIVSHSDQSHTGMSTLFILKPSGMSHTIIILLSVLISYCFYYKFHYMGDYHWNIAMKLIFECQEY